jgi:predicted dehydrogenase
MLKDDEVELVVVALPHRRHAREALRAIRAGRHVVVEKPMALTARETNAMIEAAEERGVTLTCFHCRRWDHHFLAAHRLVRDYENIGDVFEIRLDLGSYGPPPATWRSDKKISGGLMYDMGAHGIDWILNLIDKPVVAVAGYALHRMWRMVTNEAHGRLVLRFRDGEMATFCESRMHAGREPESLKILGTEGSITFPNLFDEEMQWTRVTDGRQHHAAVPCPGDEWAWAAFYHQLADHLLLGLPHAVTPHSAARVVGVLETAYRSARLGRELRFEDRYFDQRR